MLTDRSYEYPRLQSLLDMAYLCIRQANSRVLHIGYTWQAHPHTELVTVLVQIMQLHEVERDWLLVRCLAPVRDFQLGHFYKEVSLLPADADFSFANPSERGIVLSSTTSTQLLSSMR